MPELPEVETIRIGLDRLLPGLTVHGVVSDSTKNFPNNTNDIDSFLVGSRVVNVRRRAKVLIIDLNTGYSLITHLKMTGQLVFRDLQAKGFGGGHPNDSLVGKLPDKSTRVILDFGSAKLYFNDQRKFGWMRLIPTDQIDNIDFIKRLGPEPLSSDFTPEVFRSRLERRSASSIKAVLLDQTVIAGVGNIYADESLWGAKIHPATPIKSITPSKMRKLFGELKQVLELSIKKGGSTDRNYVDASGKKGSYLSFARVFRREGLPCPRCGHIIQKTRVAGRGTHFCPHCQKLSLKKGCL